MKKQMGSLFLTAMMVMSMMPMNSVAAQDGQNVCPNGDNYSLVIGDTLITDETEQYYEGVSWDSKTGELTLTNVSLDLGIKINKCSNATSDSNTVMVNLIGNNFIGKESTGALDDVGFKANELGVEFSGASDASLNVFSKFGAIVADLGLTINGGKYVLKPQNEAAIRVGYSTNDGMIREGFGGPIVINDADVEIVADNEAAIWTYDGVDSNGDITVTNSNLNIQGDYGIVGKTVNLTNTNGTIQSDWDVAISANRNMSIKDSKDLKVITTADLSDGLAGAVTGTDIDISNSTLGIEATNGGGIFAVRINENNNPENNGGKLSITSSNVSVNTTGRAVHGQFDVSISDSKVDASSTGEWSIISPNGTVTIEGSNTEVVATGKNGITGVDVEILDGANVNTTATGEYPAIFANKTIKLSGLVTAKSNNCYKVTFVKW